MLRHKKDIRYAGKSLEEASRAMIMIHGRGATAPSILALAEELEVNDMALLAPQATMNTWYPQSFLAPLAQNEPGLSTGLAMVNQAVAELKEAGMAPENIFFLGFSQGACLTSEYVARNAQRYGGVFVLSGGVIGPKLETERYSGDFAGTPILLGCSDVDAHVPLDRVLESSQLFRDMGARVTERIYPNAPHTVFEDEILLAKQILREGN